MKLKYVLLYLSCCVAFPLLAQEKQTNSIFIAGYPQADSGRILLRWGVNNYATWQKANQYGYMLERYTVSRDQKMLEVPE